MGDYIDDTYLNTSAVTRQGQSLVFNYSTIYSNSATITGTYSGINYHGNFRFNGKKYLSAETVFQFMYLNGNNVATSFYLQGKKMTFGDGVQMMNYPNTAANNEDGLIKVNNAGAAVNIPSFNIYGGVVFDKQVQAQNMSFPFSSTDLIIKSGTFARIVARKHFGRLW